MKERVNAFFLQLNRGTLLRGMRQITALLSFLVIIGVFWGLKLTGITMAGEAFCGMDEHVHTEECQKQTLICTLEETPGHVHTDDCRIKELCCQPPWQVLPQAHDRYTHPIHPDRTPQNDAVFPS